MAGEVPRPVLFGFYIMLVMRVAGRADRHPVGHHKAVFSKLGDFLGIVGDQPQASACGLTYQYEGLQELYKTYQKDGFEVLGFPCNQFGAQEPGTNEEIQFFCTNSYEVEFTLFDKIDVNGDNAAPIYKMLKKNHPAESGSNEIEWNFTKFLVGKNGEIVKRFDGGFL